MRHHRIAASFLVSLASATIGALDVHADLIVGGSVGVSNEVRFDWGPLAGQMARSATALAGETWEAFASRESGDARWAPIVRAMNGGGKTPNTGEGRTWVPPRNRAYDAASRWFSVFVDSSKFGGDSDVSRTGFDRVDPAAEKVAVFGHVTVVALEHATTDDAARSFAIPRAKARDLLARRTAPALLIAPAHEVAGSVTESSKVRRVEHAWRVEMPTTDTLQLVTGAIRTFDASGHEITGIVIEQIIRDGNSVPWLALAGGLLVALVVVASLLRRGSSARPQA